MEVPEDGRGSAPALAFVPPVSRALAWLRDGPSYPADAGDLRSVDLLGLRLPVRATLAVLAVAVLLLLDYHGRLNGLVEAVLGQAASTPAELQRLRSIGRLVMFGAVPLGLVLSAMRDRPSRYGLRLGDVRAGLAVGVGGCLLLTPVVVGVARLPEFGAYYAPQAVSAPDVFLTTALEVIPAEFFFRGFLLFALLRIAGPVAIVLATLPFAFAHLGKPEVETLSTLFGGLVYGWLDWRTGSVLWSGLAHTWILAIVVIAAGAAI